LASGAKLKVSNKKRSEERSQRELKEKREKPLRV
jgi:hypothetical protein